MSGATSWNSELPSGRNPFWIKDEALAGLGLHAGDAVSVDTRAEPAAGDLVLVEVETDELADRLVRRLELDQGTGSTRFSAPNGDYPDLLLASDQFIVLGVVRGRVRFETADEDSVRVIEEAL